MKMRIKLVAALGTATALLLPASQAGAAIGNPSANFVGEISLDELNVKCKPGDSTGTLTQRIRVAAKGTALTVAQGAGVIGNSTKIVASWPGGSSSMTRFGRQYLLSENAKFPCPAIDGSPMAMTFQPYRGSKRVGVAATVGVEVNWVGPRVVRPFAGLTSGENIFVDDCVDVRRGTDYGKLKTAFSVRASHNTAGIPEGLLGDDLNRRVTKIVASWGTGSVAVKRYDTNVTVKTGSRFPCVNPLVPASRNLTIRYQAYAGPLKIGKAAQRIVNLVQDGDTAVVSTGPVTVAPGGTVSSPSGASTPTTVQSPNGGTVVVSEAPATGAPIDGNYSFVSGSEEVTIDAPPATGPGQFLTLTFKVTAPGINEAAFNVFRNGVLVPTCTGAGLGPDPCLVRPVPKSGDVFTATARTSHASPWNFGFRNGNPSQ